MGVRIWISGRAKKTAHLDAVDAELTITRLRASGASKHGVGIDHAPELRKCKYRSAPGRAKAAPSGVARTHGHLSSRLDGSKVWDMDSSCS